MLLHFPLLTCKAGLSENKGLLFTIWAAIFGSAANACNIDWVYGAESIFCISCGFSIICCMRLCIAGVVRTPDGRVLPVLPPVPPVSPVDDQGFGRGSRFSCPCCGFVPPEKGYRFAVLILEDAVQLFFNFLRLRICLHSNPHSSASNKHM